MSGERAFMVKNTNCEFKHEANTLISFINHQCMIDGMPLKIKTSEQYFIEQVFQFNSGIIPHVAPRREGTTTLLSAIALYYALHGLNVYFFSINAAAYRQAIGMVVDALNIYPYSIKRASASMLNLAINDKITEGDVRFHEHYEIKNGRVLYSNKPNLIIIDNVGNDLYKSLEKIELQFYTIPIIAHIDTV